MPDAPPHNLEAEQSVLGACLLSAGAIDASSEILQPGDFYRASHGLIYRTIADLYASGGAVDYVTVTDELEKSGGLEEVGGKARIAELAFSVPATANAAHYARIVREMAILRGMANVGQEAIRLAHERPGETPELVERLERSVFGLARHDAAQTVQIGDSLKTWYERLRERSEAGGGPSGLLSGFHSLDRLTSGFEPGNLIVVAAGTGMGKSAFVHKLCAKVAVRDRLPVALFSLEMSQAEIDTRLIAMHSGVPVLKLREAKLDRREWDKVTDKYAELRDAPLFLRDDSAMLTVTGLQSEARRLKLRHPNLALIVVDYLQLMVAGASPENRTQEVAQITRGLKMLASSLAVPVIALSQLSRAYDHRGGGRPRLSDLRESGSIEQDANLILFLWRNEDEAGIANFYVGKNRNGPADEHFQLQFQKDVVRFSELQRDNVIHVPFGAERRAA